MQKTLIISTLVLCTAIVAGAIISQSVLATSNGFKRKAWQGNKTGQMHQQMLAKKAEFFGITTEELQTKLDNGQTFLDIMAEQGITKEDMHAKMLDLMREKWTKMGLTAEEIDQRIKTKQACHASCDGTGLCKENCTGNAFGGRTGKNKAKCGCDR